MSYDPQREELEAEFFGGSNDERFSALDPDVETLYANSAEPVRLPSWVLFPVSRSLTHLILQPAACSVCVPF